MLKPSGKRYGPTGDRPKFMQTPKPEPGDLIEDRVFLKNIIEGFEKIKDIRGESPGFLIFPESGLVKTWHPLDKSHMNMIEELKIGFDECLLGFVIKSGSDFKNINFWSPYYKNATRCDTSKCRADIIKVLRAFKEAGLPEDIEVGIVRPAYGKIKGFRNISPVKLFPELKKGRSSVSGRLSDYLRLDRG